MQNSIRRRTLVKGLSLLPLLPLVGAIPEAVAQRTVTEKGADGESAMPNILIIVFDTLSASHMSLFGYGRQTTPNIERFAERARVYHSHYAGGNFTTVGTASLLTGSYPWSHRAFNHAGTVADEYRHQNLFGAFEGYTRLAYTHNLLANSLLHQFGSFIEQHLDPSQYGLVSGSFADRIFPHDADIAGRSLDGLLLRRGDLPGSLFISLMDRMRVKLDKRVIGEYESVYPRGIPELLKLSFVLEDAIDGIMATVEKMTQPFLAYYHLLPPHEPYHPRREFIGRFKDDQQPLPKEPHFFSQKISEKALGRFRIQYDEFLAYADAEFGRLLDHLEESGRFEDTIIVFTSDHGQLFERGIHGHVTQTLYDPVVHVPLLISLPGQVQRRDVYTSTSCVDVLPTLLHLSGRPIPSWCEGVILPEMGEPTASGGRSVFAVEAKSNPKLAPLRRCTVALRQDEYLMIRYMGYREVDEAFELFDLESDPEAAQNLVSSQPAILDKLRGELEARLVEANRLYV